MWGRGPQALLAEVSAACTAWLPISGCRLWPWEQEEQEEQVLDN